MDIREIAEGYAKSIEEEWDLEELDLAEVIHQVVDGCGEVIYYYKAAELLLSLDAEQFWDAEDAARDSTEGKGWLEIACIIAYHALFNEIWEVMNDG